MKIQDKKFVAAIAGLAGLAAVLVTPISQADPYYRHHWHPAGRSVQIHGCHKVVRQRYCSIHHGYRQCYVQRWTRFVC